MQTIQQWVPALQQWLDREVEDTVVKDSLVNELDSAIVAAIGDIDDSDLDHVLGSAVLVELVRQQRKAIAALEAEGEEDVAAENEWHRRAG